MKQGLYKILENKEVACRTWRMRLEGDTSSLQRGGQFVHLALDGRFLRRPFGVADWDAFGLTFYYKVVGEGSQAMTALPAGAMLDLLTGLGNGFDASACRQQALIVSGGLGASPLFSLAAGLRRAGKRVQVIMGFNQAADEVLVQEYRDLGAELSVVTLDGSDGLKGTVCDAIRTLQPAYDYFYTCGPKAMMRAVCEMLDGPGEASLEERMACGCGICYGCTCHTKDGPRRVCTDGPVFKKEVIVW